MALIPDLPAASGLSNTDLLVIDTGSQTQKIQAQNAGASASNAGLVTTGVQTFGGAKNLANGSKVYTNKTSNRWDTLSFTADGASGSASVDFTAYSGADNNVAYFIIHGRTDDANSSYGDVFRFPEVSGARSSNTNYEILTTKTIYTKSDTSSISGVQLRRWGNIVTIFLRGASVNSSGSIGTIPADYRPSAYLYANCVHTAAGGVVRPAQITIESSGTTVISAYNGSNNYGTATNGQVNGTITFVVN